MPSYTFTTKMRFQAASDAEAAEWARNVRRSLGMIQTGADTSFDLRTHEGHRYGVFTDVIDIDMTGPLKAPTFTDPQDG